MIGQFANAVVPSPRDISDDSKKFPAARILVVDDERLVRWAIAETLGDVGYAVAEAVDGESAKRAVEMPQHAPDLVLLDLHLPDCDDLRIVSFIRAHAPNTAIVLMTADAAPDIISGARELGATFVGKPFDLKELTAIVERVLTAPAA